MELSQLLQALLRWIHIVAGILWIGLLYWFNFVNLPFAATLDADGKKKVFPELLPRALYWFRWGAAFTFFSGALLLMLVIHMGGAMFEEGVNWTIGSYVMLAVVYLGVFIYDYLYKTLLSKNDLISTGISFILVGVVIFLFFYWGQYTYRAYVIHTGAMFGTIMAFNVWFRIWPAQKKIIPAIKNGEAPDASLVALAGMRSKHNTYMSVPLVWAMINSHTPTFSGGNYGLTTGTAWLGMLVIIAIGWLVVAWLYKKSARVPGF